MRLLEFIVEPDREDRIARHHVTAQEAEEVVCGYHAAYRAKHDRFRLIGQTVAGRNLAVIVAPRGGGVYALVTAREATESERRRLRTERRR